GDLYTFDMVLMTHYAVEQLPLIVAAWKRAFSKGAGRQDGRAELQRVECIGPDASTCTLSSPGHTQVLTHRADFSVPSFSAPADAKPQLETRLRIEQKNRLIRTNDLTASLFLRHLIRRVSFHIAAQHENAFSLDEIRQFNMLADSVAGQD